LKSLVPQQLCGGVIRRRSGIPFLPLRCHRAHVPQ
jgi:hypothetical protein